MSSLRRIVRACLLVGALTTAAVAASAGAASATTFYVNGGVSASGNCLTPSTACKTINEAVVKARLVVDTATIDVAAGTYTEDLELNQDGDTGLTINGAGSAAGGTTIQGVNGKQTIKTAPMNTGPTTIENLRVVNPVGDTSPGLEFLISPFVLVNVAVEMADPANSQTAIKGEQTTATLDQVSVGGLWTGHALLLAGSVTIAKSSFTANTAALQFIAGTTVGGHQDVISDSSVQSNGTAPVNIEAIGVDLTIDSSLLLGGKNIGLEWNHPFQKQRTLTIAGSTIDAGMLGVRDALPISDVFAIVSGSPTPNAVGNVSIEGSILVDSQTAILGGAGNQLTITCTNSDVPNQAQSSDGTTKGAINCASGVSGNTTTEPLTSLFVAPGSNYSPLPGSSAIDSVPAGAISLPFGLTPSATDVLGNPRVVDGNGDCVALQDRGAIELQGHSVPCPNPPAPKAVAGSITNLSVSPNAFFAAPSGATISKTKKAKKYGATVSYKDSQTATTTFTVLKESSGRTQGKACKKPSKANKHGKHCTIYTALGSFTHIDVAGANKFHFSGRLKGKPLGKGSYKLQAVPHNAAGNGLAVSKQFKIK